MRSDAGQYSILRILAVVAVLGLIAFEIGGIAINRAQASDVAGQTASEAGITYTSQRDFDAANQRAKEYAAANGAKLIGDVRIDPAARTCTVTVEKVARTFVIKRISSLKHYTVARATESAPLRTGG